MDLRDIPFVWIGSPRQIADRLAHHEERWGIDRYVVRASQLDDVEKVLGTSR